MDIDNEIDSLIKDIGGNSEYKELYEDDFYNNELGSEDSHRNYQNYKLTIQECKSRGLITGLPTFSRRLVLTQLGKNVIDSGGWQKYIEKQASKKIREQEKEDYDFKTKKWIYKTRLVPYFVSGVALIISIVTLVLNIRKDVEEKKMKKEIQNLNKQIEQKNLLLKSNSKDSTGK